MSLELSVASWPGSGQCVKGHGLPTPQGPAGLGRGAMGPSPVPQDGMLKGAQSSASRCKALTASCFLPTTGQGPPSPPSGTSRKHVCRWGGGHHRTCLFGVKPSGCPALLTWVLLPYPPKDPTHPVRKTNNSGRVQTGRDGIKNGRGRGLSGGNTESRRAGTDRTQGSPRQLVARGGNQKDSALNFLVSFRAPPPTPFPRVSVGGPGWGGQPQPQPQNFLKVYIAVAFWGAGAAPPGPAPQPHPLMTLSLLY